MKRRPLPENAGSRARGPYKWNAARVAAVCARHAAGVWLKHACALEGGSYEGLRDAMARDPATFDAVAKAHAEGGELMRRRMLEAGVEVDGEGRIVRTGDWKREAWLLERWDPETFHLTNKVESKNEHTGKDGAPLLPTPSEAKAEIAKRLEAMPPEERELAERLLAR